jgi:hypothetical protein
MPHSFSGMQRILQTPERPFAGIECTSLSCGVSPRTVDCAGVMRAKRSFPLNAGGPGEGDRGRPVVRPIRAAPVPALETDP